MDFTIQALVGAMSITGYPDMPPVKCGPTFIDMLGATHLFAGILLALRERERSGRGQRVEVAMFDAAVPALLSYLAPFYGHIEITPQRQPPRRRRRDAVQQLPCIDGYVAIMCVSDQHWLDLCADGPTTCSPTNVGTAYRSVPSGAIEAEVASGLPATRADVAARSRPPASPARQSGRSGGRKRPHMFERAVVRDLVAGPRPGQSARDTDKAERQRGTKPDVATGPRPRHRRGPLDASD